MNVNGVERWFWNSDWKMILAVVSGVYSVYVGVLCVALLSASPTRSTVLVNVFNATLSFAIILKPIFFFFITTPKKKSVYG